MVEEAQEGARAAHSAVAAMEVVLAKAAVVEVAWLAQEVMRVVLEALVALVEGAVREALVESFRCRPLRASSLHC